MFISAAKGQLSLKINVMEETGLRPIEITGTKGIKAKDLHKEQSTLTSINTKRCNPRPPIKISEQLKIRLLTHITKNNLQANDPIFKSKSETFGKDFRRLRNRLATKLNEPRIKGIRLYDIRHYYITQKCRQIQNAEIVRQLVGHKRLDTTQKYMHLSITENTEWITEGTTDEKRAEQLLAANFNYQLTTPDGTMLFKKAK
jgi:integrase